MVRPYPTALIRPTATGRRMPLAPIAFGTAAILNNLLMNRREQRFIQNRNIGNGGVTNQHDSKTTYKKRKYRKKRKNVLYKKFKKFYRRALLKDLGTNSLVFNDTLTTDDWNTNDQQWRFCHLNAANGTPSPFEVGETDLQKAAANNINTDEMTEKGFVQGSFMDITFHNTSSSTDLEVDVYWLVYKKTSRIANGLSLFLNAESATGVVPAQGPSQFADLSISQRGVTPFQFPAALAQGVTILKKVKHFVPRGGYFTTQWKHSRSFMYNPLDLSSQGFNFKGKTVTCLIISKKLTGHGAQGGSYSIGCTRTYTTKWLENNKDYNGQLVNGG